MKADVAVIGAGAIGAQTAVQLVERGLDVVLIEPGAAGADHAASYGNAAWLSSHSVVPPAAPASLTAAADVSVRASASTIQEPTPPTPITQTCAPRKRSSARSLT